MNSVFENEQKGEINMLRNMLDSNDKPEIKSAAKRVISLMRSGENVGSLFSSMLRCVKTPDIELKKLAYLYLVNYSGDNSEESIMAVNTFIQDSQDGNPLVRALSVRTMSRIRIETVAEYMVMPIKSRLEDTDPYVRKTAALAVSKLYRTVPESIEDSGILSKLVVLLHDSNPLVISNATISIMEINKVRPIPIFIMDENNIIPILSAISSSSEWCQIALFDAIAEYEPPNSSLAATLIDRVSVYLKNSNPAVVIGAFKCVLKYIDYDERLPLDVFSKVLPPFVSLISSTDSEIQFIVLRTLSQFVKKYPSSLSKEIRLFFCKYNDPSYIKLEKLEIISVLSSLKTISYVIDELAEYCNSVDVAFVKKSIKVLGEISLKFPESASKCITVLMKLVTSRAEYAIESSIIVVANLLRCYPGQFESIIESVCSNIDSVKDKDAKCSLIWILGEYSGLIDNIDLLIDPFLDTFHDEHPDVQIQIITTVVKVFLKKPEETKDQLQFVFSEASKESCLPDVRNRAIVYWRLLSADRDATEKIVLFNKVPFGGSTKSQPDDIVSDLLWNAGNVSGVLHIHSSAFSDNSNSNEKAENPRIWNQTQCNPSSLVEVSCDWDTERIHFNIKNLTNDQLSNLAIAIKPNQLGIEFIDNMVLSEMIEPLDEIIVSIPYQFSLTQHLPNIPNLEFALRTSQGVVYFNDCMNVSRFITNSRGVKRSEFLQIYQNTNTSVSFTFDDEMASDITLKKRGISVIARKEEEVCLSFIIAKQFQYIGDFEITQNLIKGVVKGNPKFLYLISTYSAQLFSDENPC